MQVIDLIRKFTYNGISLGDPNPALTPDQVKEVFAGQYPELTNSVVEGPVTKAGVATYTFARAVGAKGATAQEVVDAALAPRSADNAQLLASAVDNRYANEAVKLESVCRGRSGGTPMAIPATAFGLWG